jgi:hypothetical protein
MINWKGFGRKRLQTNFKALSQNSPGRTEENHEDNSVRIAGLRVKI